MSPATVLPKKKQSLSFRKGKTIGPLHTGGPLAACNEGRRVVTCVGDDVVLTDVESGIETCRFQGDTTSATSLCISPSSKNLAIFSSSISLRIYDLPSSSEPLSKSIQPIRHIARAHDAPVHVSVVDPSSSYLASGSADGVVKVWDLHRGYVTHVFKAHGGVVSALYFHHKSAQEIAESSSLILFTGSVDNRIRMFNLNAPTRGAGKPDILFEGHVSVPRGLAVSNDGRWLISGGRDSVILLWDLKNKGKGHVTNPTKTIPATERVEALGIIPNLVGSSTKTSSLRIYTGGEQGIIKVWDVWEGMTIAKMSPQHVVEDEQREIVHMQYIPSTAILLSLHADHNILFHSVLSHKLTRQLIGFNDEITDAILLKVPSAARETHLAMATNSTLIRVYSLEANDSRLLSGHSNIVLSLDKGAGGRVFASGSKDKSARIWACTNPNVDVDERRWGCVAVCEGHAESVGAIAMSRTENTGDKLRFMFTGSQDRTIKMWDLSAVPVEFSGAEDIRPKSLCTHRAHDKDINSLDVSPNDKLLASGSQDKTAKIFQVEYSTTSSGVRGEIRLLGVCKGHKRGVWNVRFSRTERFLATGSGDKTVKLWSLDDFSCVKTFEGHTNSILRLEFIKEGQNLLSSGSDGLVKLWDIRREECVSTLDNHEDKVWALTISSDERSVVSAGADSMVTFWDDCTEGIDLEKQKAREQNVLREQDFANYVSLHDYRNAILLALSMDHPGRLLSLFRAVRASQDTSGEVPTIPSITGHPSVDRVLKTLPIPALATLLVHIRTWNATARTSNIAQTILYTLLKLRSTEDIASALNSPTLADGDTLTLMRKETVTLKEFVESVVPYTERHLMRVEKLIQDSWVVDFVLGEMDGGFFDETGGVESMDTD